MDYLNSKLNFNEQVFTLVRQIPVGKLLSYGRIAQLLGKPNGAREVGWALAQASHAKGSQVPWWRVVNRLGHITTPAADGSQLEQRERLITEGVEFDDKNHFQVSHFDAILWHPSPIEIIELLQAHSNE